MLVCSCILGFVVGCDVWLVVVERGGICVHRCLRLLRCLWF